MKIVSLVPSLTELLFHLGLEEMIVGRTKFCIHPAEKVKIVPKIGGTKNVNIQKVLDLKPDLVLANKEENTKSDIEALKQNCNVHVTEIENFKQAIFAIDDIGLMTNTAVKATTLIEEIEASFSQLKPKLQKAKICYLIWQKPYMSIGNDTYIHDMLEICGFENICKDQTRYPELTLEDIKSRQPNYIFLSSEPFPFKQVHIDELKDQMPNCKILLVDGEYFSWYGSRMVGAAQYFGRLVEELN
ncbi:MAG: ABC-type Fe3+-hydroxamate transport system substrate-binding protein [Saprospiraceae bacterium]